MSTPKSQEKASGSEDQSLPALSTSELEGRESNGAILPGGGWRNGQPMQRVAPLVKAGTSVDKTQFVKEGPDDDVATASYNHSAPVLHTNSAPGMIRPAPSSAGEFEPLKPLPPLNAARSLLKRPAARPGARPAAALSQTLGRGRKDGLVSNNTPPRQNYSGHRRTRSKSLPGLPSWLLQRRNNNPRHSKQLEFIPGVDLSQNPEIAALRQAGFPPRAAELSRASSSIENDEDSDSDSDSDSDTDSETETMPTNAAAIQSPQPRPNPSLSNPSHSALNTSTGSLSLESPSSTASSSTPPPTGVSASPRSAATPTKPSKDSSSSSKKSKDKSSSKSKDEKKAKDASSSSSSKSKSKDKSSKHKKIKSGSSTEDNASSQISPASTKVEQQKAPLSTATSSSSSSTTTTQKTGGGPRSGTKKFVTAFDWLKSYAAGQVQLDEEVSSSEEVEEPARSVELPFAFANDGTGSGDEDEYDEEELHLISDTDDVSASVDHDILDSSSGGFLSPSMAMRRPFLNQSSSGVSSSSSSMATGTPTSGSKVNRQDSSELDTSSSGSTSTPIRGPSGSSPSPMQKSGSAYAVDAAGRTMSPGQLKSSLGDSPSTSTTGSPAHTKASKRKTDRPASRHRDQEGETATAESIEDDSIASSPSSLRSSRGTKRSSERRPHRSAAEGEATPTGRRTASPARECLASAHSPSTHSPSPTPTDAVIAVNSAKTLREGKAPKPKFNRAATVFEERSSSHSRASSSGGSPATTTSTQSFASTSASNKFSRASKDLSGQGTSSASSGASTHLSPSSPANSWKKSPDVVKLRKKSVRMQNLAEFAAGASAGSDGTTGSGSGSSSGRGGGSAVVGGVGAGSGTTNDVVLQVPVNASAGGASAGASKQVSDPQATSAAAASKHMLANLHADLEEYEEDGVRFVLPPHPPNAPRLVYAISLDKLLELIFEDWNKERVMRDDFLSVMPFVGKPVEIIEAMSLFWTRRLAAFKASAAEAQTSASLASTPSSKKQSSSSSSSSSKKGEKGLFEKTPLSPPASPDPLRASLTASNGMDEIVLQKRIISFITEWVKTNFTYFTEMPVLEALCRFLDRLCNFNTTSVIPSTPGNAVSSGASSPVSAREASKTMSSAAEPCPTGASSSSSSAVSPSSKLPTLKLSQLKQTGGSDAALSAKQSSANPAAAAAPTTASSGDPTDPARWVDRDLLMRIVQYKLAGIDPRDLPGLVVRMKHPRSGVKMTTLNTSRGQVQMFQAADALKWLRKLQEDNVGTPQASLFKRLLGRSPSNEAPTTPAPLSARGGAGAAGGTSSSSSIIISANNSSSSHTNGGNASFVPPVLQRDASMAGVLEIDCMEVLTQLLKERLIAQVSSKSGKVRESVADENGDFQVKKKKTYAFTITEHVESNARLMNLQPLTRGPASASNNGCETQTFFLQTQPDTFARQLAIMELNLFQRIEPHEMHMWVKSSDKAKRAKAAPNLLRLTNNFNRMTAWVATEIVTTANPKQRISTLKRFILVAQYCLKYKNYQGLLEVMLGMQDTCVSRLSAWRALPEKYTHMFNRLSEITNPVGNWKNFRLLIESEQSACVPYIGLLTSDLTFVQDATSSELPDKRINWKKATRIAATFAALKRMQRRAYTFAPDFGIIQYITDGLVTIEEDKERLIRSRLLEPTRARSGSIV